MYCSKTLIISLDNRRGDWGAYRHNQVIKSFCPGYRLRMLVSTTNSSLMMSSPHAGQSSYWVDQPYAHDLHLDRYCANTSDGLARKQAQTPSRTRPGSPKSKHCFARY